MLGWNLPLIKLIMHAYFSYSIPYELPMDETFNQEHGRETGKDVMGWRKLRAPKKRSMSLFFLVHVP